MSPIPHFRAEGAPTAPVLILGPSLGTSLAVWDAQTPDLARSHRVVRWDLPGHGGSPASLVGEGATVADLAALVLALADHLGAERFDYAGISLGGAIGLHLAVHHPERLTSLAVVCSAARFGTPADWRDRAELVRTKGTETLTDAVANRWFTPAFAESRRAAELVADLAAVDPAGYAACCDALGGYDLRPDLGRITVPTLVVAGREDPATSTQETREMADAIGGSTLLELPAAAHLAPVERPAAVLAALQAHLASTSPGR